MFELVLFRIIIILEAIIFDCNRHYLNSIWANFRQLKKKKKKKKTSIFQKLKILGKMSLSLHKKLHHQNYLRTLTWI